MIIVHLVRRLAVKRLMRPSLIVEHQIAFQPLVYRADGIIRVQIHLLIFNPDSAVAMRYGEAPAL
jgi:hypothetical protein